MNMSPITSKIHMLVMAGMLSLLPLLSAAAISDWQDDIIYFVLIDRYADGDADNIQRVQRNNPGGYHGGDLKGLTRQLGDLADLGITALWINPVQKQISQGMYAQAPAKLGLPEFNHWGFHGYWIDDFNAIEPQFGTLDDLKTLVSEAHKLNIKVLLDVVYNHSGYNSSYQNRKTINGESWLRNKEGSCDVDPLTCRVGGLPDFKTEIPEVRNYLLDANIKLAKEAGVDGFRLDTYKHVETDFWLQHRQRTHSELGNNFFLLAEYWGGNAISLDSFFERDEIDAGIDFSFKGSCESFVNGRGRAIAFGNYLGKRHKVRPGYLLAHYLSSHDENMALYQMGKDKDKFRLCAALQMTSIGMPIIYYGEEVARSGSEWPLNRNDMPWGERDIKPGKGEKRDEAMRSFYKSLLGIRHQHPALSRGGYTLLSPASDKLLAYVRHDATTADAVLVIVNREETEQQARYTLPAYWKTATVINELTQQKVAVVDGKLNITLAARSVQILSTTSPRVNP